MFSNKFYHQHNESNKSIKTADSPMAIITENV